MPFTELHIGRAERVREFRALVLALMAIGVILLPALIILEPALRVQSLVALSLIEGLAMLSLWLRPRVGHDAACWVLILGQLGLVTVMAVGGGGIRNPGIPAFIVFAFLAWQLLGQRAGLITAALCATIGLALALAEEFGVLPEPWVRYSPIALWLINGFYIGVIIVLIQFATRSLTRAIGRADVELAERRRAEGELEAVIEQLRQFIRYTPAAVALFDNDMRYLQVSERWLTDYHLGGQNVIGRSHYEVFPDIPDRWKAVHRRVLAGAVERCDEDPFPRADGGMEWLEWECRPWRRANGEIGGLTMQTQVITERKRAEQRLAENENRFRSLVENALVGVYIIQDGRLTYVNSALEQIFGYGPGQLTGASPLSVVQPVDHDMVSEKMRMRLAGELTEPRYEFLGRKKDGETLLIQVMGSRIQLEGGYALIGNLRDITRERQAEAAIAASEGRFRALIEQAPTAVGIAKDGVVLYVNRQFVDMFGLTDMAEATGRPVESFWAPSSRPEVRERARRSAAGLPLPSRFEGIAQRKDGTEFQMRADIARVDLPDGPANLAFLSDVSDRVRLETEFRQAQKMEAVGRLAGGVAHDFNNLLTVILGCGEVVLEGMAPDDPRRQEVGDIVAAAERAASLTRQLLAFSRRQMLELKTLNLNDVVAGVESMLHRLLSEDVALVTRPAAGLHPVLADPGQIEQVIMNLAVNARDAMPNGGTLTISTANVIADDEFVRTHPDAAPGRWVRLVVSDTGVGMTPAVQSKVFEPFFTTKEPGKGTGLGLSTVYGIIMQSHGFITFTSEVGRGTSFEIYLPSAVSDAGRPADAAATTTTPVNGHETVLVVEDNGAVRNLVVNVLRGSGYDVLAAENGREAIGLAAAQPGPIDLLLTDVIMPEMGGRELVDRLLQDRPTLKVLYMTGYFGDAAGIKGSTDRGGALLRKPFTPAVLCQKVREVLDR